MTQALPDVALSAWAAYQEMEESKKRYFGHLAQFEERASDDDDPGADERAHLEKLLNAHHIRVHAFREAMQALSAEDPDAHRILVEHMTHANAKIEATPGSTPGSDLPRSLIS